MDEIYKPIVSTLPNGLTLATMRTERKGIIGGQLGLCAGGLHGKAVRPEWLGLPHLLEHMILYGASRKFESRQARNLLNNHFFTFANAATSLDNTRYFSQAHNRGMVFPKEDFWDAFDVVTDGVYFPKFDPKTFQIELPTVLDEIKGLQQPGKQAQNRGYSILYQMPDLMNSGGLPEIVAGYTKQDMEAFHHRAYTLDNTVFSVVGDIDHAEAAEQILARLTDVPSHLSALRPIDKMSFTAEQYINVDPKAEVNDLYVELHLKTLGRFDLDRLHLNLALSDLQYFFTNKIRQEFQLYNINMMMNYPCRDFSSCVFSFKFGDPSQARPVLQRTIELLQSDALYQGLEHNHANLQRRKVFEVRTDQTFVENIASTLLDSVLHQYPFVSNELLLHKTYSITPAQIRDAVQDMAIKAPAFLWVTGHEDAVKEVPSLDEISGWRSGMVPHHPSEKRMADVAKMTGSKPDGLNGPTS